jgi:trk system potassium uptake protein TrkH
MKKLSPPHVLIFGFLSIILVGTLLLLAPVSTVRGISAVDALFTSTSAVCVTGLIVKSTPHDFTLFGKVVILLLIQIGGLGYMTSATIISLLVGKRIGLGERLVMKEAMNVLSVEGIVRFTKAVLITTVVMETAGAALLTARFLVDHPAGNAVFLGVFHSISAFNNAGFSLFPDSLVRYRGDIAVNLVVMSLIILGGLGFLVVSDVYGYWRKETMRLSFHTKIVLSTTLALIAAGAVLIFFFENGNVKTFQTMSLPERVLAALFGSVTARTAGFNTVDYSSLHLETLFASIVFMFIGASPGSTGGGVKTTTFAVVMANLCATLRSRRDTVMFRRRVPLETIAKSYMTIAFAALLIIVVTVLVLRSENINYLSAVFEVVSAFGTVGLSMGDGGVRSLSALFSPFGKVLITVTMFAGRLGPLTLAVAVARKREVNYRYPEGKVMIG